MTGDPQKPAPAKSVQRQATNTLVARTTVDVLFDGDVSSDGDAVVLAYTAAKKEVAASFAATIAVAVAGTGEHALTLKNLKPDVAYALRYVRAGGATSVVFEDVRVEKMVKAGGLPPEVEPSGEFWEDEHYEPASNPEFARTPVDIRAGAMSADEED